MRIERPCETVVQLSGENESAERVLSVVVKRTYRVVRGRCVLHEKQMPLRGLEIDEKAVGGRVLYDSDVYPFKPLTDVVVVGHAYSYDGWPRTQAQIRVGPAIKRLSVSGDRRVARDHAGRLAFSEPSGFEKIPLSSDYAYGGFDEAAERKYGNPYEILAKHTEADQRPHSPFRYARNRHGRGYLIEATDESLANLELPNLEDPADRLSPERLEVHHPARWPTMPLPWFLGWTSPAEFPRIAFTGAAHPFDPSVGTFPEATRGLLPPGFPRLGPITEVFDARFWNGASLGLCLGPLGATPDAIEFELMGLHPRERTFAFRLPREKPEIWTCDRSGTMTKTVPMLHDVVIEPDEDRVTLLWRGASPAKRTYLLEELLEMPLRVDWPD